MVYPHFVHTLAFVFFGGKLDNEKTMRYSKGSFITVPNKEALRGMKPATQCLFMWLCQYANTTGKCFPSKKTLATDTGMSESAVLRSMKELEDARLVIKENRTDKKKGNKSNLYHILIWGVSERQEGGVRGTREGVSDVPTNSNHIELKPDNSTPPQDGEGVDGALVNKLIDAFVDVNPSFTLFYRRKNQRDAAKRLIAQHGLERMIAVVKFLPTSNRVKFAPTITSPTQLEERIAALFAWAEKEKGEKRGKGIIGL